MVGCRLSEPTKPTDSLLIGKIALVMQGFDSSENMLNQRVNGSQSRGINVTFRDMETRKIYCVMTDGEGFFYIVNPKPGIYDITQLEFKLEAGGGWIQITDKSEIPIHVMVQPGEVFNLGIIQWLAATNKQQSIHFFSTVTPDDHPEQLKDIFEKKYPNSLWLQKNWVNVKVNFSKDNRTF
jgi:hypothetical protein